LQEVRERQERERREFIRKQQDAFRRAVEERQTVDKNTQYMQKSKSGWVNEVKVEGSRDIGENERKIQELKKQMKINLDRLKPK
jgi:hypothetical protein